jgi:protein-S-isoprenylcysteine O-methyltransferase Ste14
MDITFRIAILVLTSIALGVSVYFRTKAMRGSPDKLDRTQEGVPQMILLRIAGLAVWVSVLLYIINPAWIAFASVPLPDWARWLGLALSTAALPLLIWMFRSLGGNITDTVDTRKNATLVTRGPYRWIRHPLYSFGTLFFLGIILMAANWLIALCGGIALTMLALRTPREEAQLVEKFGDEYRGYMAHTGRYLPKLTH